jgi:hypothetical protein
MKASLLCGAPLFSLAAFAFPANLLQNDISQDTLAEITALATKITREAESKPKSGNVKRGFNAEAQSVSITGEHKYVSDRSVEKSGVATTNHPAGRSRQAPMTSADLAPV